MSNALKFTPTGTIRIDAELESERGPWRIVVQDTGSGIAEADRERIFEAFEQAGPSGRVSAGSGLGLAICRRLARLLGGDVNVDSTLGAGSTFVLTLPLEPQMLIAPDVTERATARASRERRRRRIARAHGRALHSPYCSRVRPPERSCGERRTPPSPPRGDIWEAARCRRAGVRQRHGPANPHRARALPIHRG